ncbi:hypothetical protein V6N13_044277 [Hibiscus sabdariffa]|uniref:Uncharacterized protein n=1 Tax=Hibiscus sabdariffa TaxID=183260 RepID=A0ABR2RI13_9ROSI
MDFAESIPPSEDRMDFAESKQTPVVSSHVANIVAVAERSIDVVPVPAKPSFRDMVRGPDGLSSKDALIGDMDDAYSPSGASVAGTSPNSLPHCSENDMYGPWMQVESRRRRQGALSRVGNRDKNDPSSSRGSHFAVLESVAEGSRPKVVGSGNQTGLSVGVQRESRAVSNGAATVAKNHVRVDHEQSQDVSPVRDITVTSQPEGNLPAPVVIQQNAGTEVPHPVVDRVQPPVGVAGNEMDISVGNSVVASCDKVVVAPTILSTVKHMAVHVIEEGSKRPGKETVPIRKAIGKNAS